MQEIDQVGIARPVTKGAWEVPSPERIPEYVALAFRTALSDRQGPVHLTIPHDYQSAEVDASDFERYAPREYSMPTKVMADPERIRQALQILNSSERPLIMAGSSAGATADPEEMLRLVETTRIPFVSEDSARALIPDSHPYSMGLGYLPLNRAAQLVREADAVLMLGKRLDYTLGFGGTPPFAPDVKLIVADPSPAQIGRARSADVAVLSDLGPACSQMADEAMMLTWTERSDWINRLRRTHEEWFAELYEQSSASTPMHPMYVSETLQKFLEEDAHITFDGGDYCHFLRASIPREQPFRFHNVSSFGMIGGWDRLRLGCTSGTARYAMRGRGGRRLFWVQRYGAGHNGPA